MNNLKGFLVFLLSFIFACSYAQQKLIRIDGRPFLLTKLDSTALFSKKYDFSKHAVPTDIKTKVDFVIDEVIGRVPDGVHFYTKSAYKKYSELLKERNNLDLLYNKLDTAEINRNLHFFDINKDGKIDCIYDKLDFADDNLQFIHLFLNQGNTYKLMDVLGFFVTNFYFDENNAVFETYQWACCDEPCEHNYTVKIKNDTMEVAGHVLVPRNLSFSKEDYPKSKSTLLKKEQEVYSKRDTDWILDICNKKTIIPKGEKVKVYDKKRESNGTWMLIKADCPCKTVYERKYSKIVPINIIGWIFADKK